MKSCMFDCSDRYLDTQTGVGGVAVHYMRPAEKKFQRERTYIYEKRIFTAGK